MPPLTFVIRPCRPGEEDAVLALWAEARSEHATTQDRLEDVRQLVTEMPGSVLVAVAGDALVGVLVAAWDGWRGNMYRLAVHRQARRQGVGLALVSAGEHELRRKRARRISALVANVDEDATAFWESAGYGRDPGIARHVRNL